MENSQPRLLIPALAPFYRSMSCLVDPLVRLSVGGTVLVHGIFKLMSGPAPVIASMASHGIQPAAFFGYLIIFVETVGALCIVLGAFTRFFAAALAIESFVIAFFIQFPAGFMASRGGYEMVLTWTGIFIAIALRGGGTYSLDRKIGVEL